ncbi:hypothetical protein [Brumimicrobium aurantiacum]|uniref:Uncharacterized protein n=1 Tax=Brumimicrobium aurantiacum TaxID=1737063 RepID=A0A3E1F1S9_9FLAO|nr:hypothetical protein [Brumimicrobium aurantiacum]RFC55766.1 hypothetical protein DXU93_02185 [Brumimicrobium aurantiacum]
MKFDNQLSEAFFQYSQGKNTLTDQNYFISEGFTRYDQDYCLECTYPSYPVTGIKFRISLKSVEEEMLLNVVDTIIVNQSFYKVKHFIDYSEPELEELFRIEKCYLINYNFKKAEYLFRLDDVLYKLKISKKMNHPALIRKLISKEEIPSRYLKMFFQHVGMYNHYGQNDYTNSFGFGGDEIFKRSGNTKIEFLNIPKDSVNDKP